MNRLLAMIGGAAALNLVLVAGAAAPAIDASKSTLSVTFVQEKVPVTEPFTRFSGHIDYDPAHPETSKAAIEVTTASLDMGSDEYSAEVRKKDWLDSGAYPTSTFVASAIKPATAGHFDATGVLTLKGKTQTLTVPVTVTHSGATTSFDGTLQISRSAFGIGDPEWNDVLDDKVSIKFHLVE
ncbi:MAG TPA: YceI family protein [Steroidobacteraceae bacterium]